MAITIPMFGGPTQASLSSDPQYGIPLPSRDIIPMFGVVGPPWLSFVSDFTSRANVTNVKEINALTVLAKSLMTTYTASGRSYWNQCIFMNTVSPTSLTAAKAHFKYVVGQPPSAINIGTDATHSSTGVQFNGTTQGWDLGCMLDGLVTLDSIVMIMGRVNTVTIAGVPFGGSCIFFPRSGGTSGYLSGTLFGTLSAPGLYMGSNDGTYITIYKDAIRQVPSAETVRLTAPLVLGRNFFFGCRNSTPGSGTPINFQNEKTNFIAIFDMRGNIWSDAEIRTLNTIIQTYNQTVV